MDKILNYLKTNNEKFVKRLADSVEIASISGSPKHRQECIRQMHEGVKLLESVQATTELVDIGEQKMHDGNTYPLPPVILARVGNDPAKKTLLIYGHLDVQPALKSDGWDTEPFKMVEKDRKFYGRGTTDDKGPILGWINVLEAYQQTGNELPINLKFCFEGMEESGSVNLEQTVRSRTDFFGKEVDWVCISDNYFLGRNKPCLTYGLRGQTYFYIEVKGPKQDLHSGVFGGSIPEPMIELSHLFASLVDTDGHLLVPGVLDEVDKVTEEERATYQNIDFSLDDFAQDIGARKLTETTKADLLMRRWRMPTLSVHGVQGAFAEPGEKTVIPGTVIGKFSIRLVPSMTREHVEKSVVDHVMKVHDKLNTKNAVKCYLAKKPGRPWLADYKNQNFSAAIRAIESVWGVKPDLTREGGSIPITLVFEEVTGKSVCLLPMGACDDGAHSQNEKLNRNNYEKGMEVFAHYIHQLGAL